MTRSTTPSSSRRATTKPVRLRGQFHPKRTAARTAAWREGIRSRTPARRTPTRLLLELLLVDALMNRVQAELARATGLATTAAGIATQASDLVVALEKRSAALEA